MREVYSALSSSSESGGQEVIGEVMVMVRIMEVFFALSSSSKYQQEEVMTLTDHKGHSLEAASSHQRTAVLSADLTFRPPRPTSP